MLARPIPPAAPVINTVILFESSLINFPLVREDSIQC
jgi:hypothetical protein